MIEISTNNLRGSNNNKGFGAVGIMLSMLILAISFSISIGGVLDRFRSSENRGLKWQLDLTAQSIGNAITSLMIEDFTCFTQGKSIDGEGYMNFTSAEQLWLKSWEKSDPSITSISFRIRLLDKYDSPVLAKPRIGALIDYQREIETTILYRPTPDSKIESLDSIAVAEASAPKPNTWRTIESSCESEDPESPEARGWVFTSIWTGKEMIVWGGLDASGRALNTGGRYNPETDSWTSTSVGTNVPAPRNEHAAIWDPIGKRMIVWGGSSTGGSQRNSGGIYHPDTDEWESMPDAPIASWGPSAVWTGSEMLVWGGGSGINRGYRFNPDLPDAFKWREMTTVGAPVARTNHVAVWTGTEMIVWGGNSDTSAPYPAIPFGGGGAYNPTLNTWRTIANPPQDIGVFDSTAIWTGTEMVVWGGNQDDTTLSGQGGRYNPSTDTWRIMNSEHAPSPRKTHLSSLWTGKHLLVWGGLIRYGSPYVNTNRGGIYDPAKDEWDVEGTSVDTNVPEAGYVHVSVWTGDEMIIFGGSVDGNQSGQKLDRMARYTPPQEIRSAQN